MGAMCVLGTFSQYAVISEYSAVKVDDDYPFEVGALVGCGRADRLGVGRVRGGGAGG